MTTVNTSTHGVISSERVAGTSVHHPVGDKERREGAPRYPQDNVPAYISEYGRTVDGYHGAWV